MKLFRYLAVAALLAMGASAPSLAAEPCVGQPGKLVNFSAPCTFINVNSDGSIITSPGPGSGTPTGGTAHVIVTGGTAITAVTGPIRGCYIVNPFNAAGQGIATAENAYVDPVGTPGSTDAAGSGTTLILQPGQSYSCPPMATGLLVKINAATTSHAFTVVAW